MDSINDSSVTAFEVQMLLGEMQIANYALRRRLEAAMKRIAELEKPKEE